jgi:mono/diheme cytochrome c family protein
MGRSVGLKRLVYGLAILLPATSLADQPARPAARTGGKGQTVFTQACSVCHMTDGSGVPNLQPAIDGGNRVVVGDPNTLITLLLQGAQTALPADRERFSNQMPTFETLTDDEIAAVLTYIRSSFGNKASAVTPKQVAAARAKR